MAFIDLVRWSPQDDITVYAYKYPENNLSTYTQLIVQESQEALLFSKGQLLQKFGPGKHTLSTENIPVLRSLFGIPFGGQNPFTAEVWFVNKIQAYNIEWSVTSMNIHDVDYNTGIPIIALGSYGLKVEDAERFLIKMVGTKALFNEYDMTAQFAGEFSSKAKSAILQFMLINKIGIKQIAAYLDNLSNHLREVLVPFWKDHGLDLTKFYVTSVEVDGTTEEGQRIRDAISKQSAQSISGYTWQQEQAFGMANNAIDGISNSNSGLLGAVLATNMMGGGGLGNFGASMMQPQYQQPTFAGNGNKQGVAMTANQNLNPIQAPSKEVFCSNCSNRFGINNRFCPHCGDAYDACPSCGADNDKKAKRCVSCGTGLASEVTVCFGCNNPISMNSSFCTNCGQQQNENNCGRCSFTLPIGVKFCPKCGLKK
jgi:membrane protease subunit (stomatin/prohibitin family)